MRGYGMVGAATLVACVAQPALAASTIIQAVPIGRETVRYDQGVPTLDLHGRAGAVQVTPLGIDHGNLVFGVAVFNDGPLPAAFDRANIRVTSGGLPVPVLSPETLASKAKSRSIWRMVALAAVGGVAAVASANQQDRYRTTVRTPRGSYRVTQRGPSAAGQANAAFITAATGAGIATMQARLDDARARIGMETLQLTTVDPSTGYGGRITLARIRSDALPQPVAIHVDWNGEGYDFGFRIAPRGMPMPIFAAPEPAAIPAAVPAVPVAPPPAMPVIAAASTRPAVILRPATAPMPLAPRAAPVSVSYVAPVDRAGDYQRRLADQRGVHGRDAQQGWSISD